MVTGAPGSTATVDEVPITGGVRLDFTLPAADGFYNAGTYDSGAAYTKDQVVRHNGSSFIALQAVPAGTSPSSAFPPVDTAFWQVLAAKGADGLGTGDVMGPSSAVDERIAVFDGATGKLIKDGGVTVAELVPADNSITNAKLADVPTATIKGRVAAGSGDPTDLTASQVLTLLKSAGAYARDNILGTVSQASGVPTGAIVERGSNANGSYVRWADGTQICIQAYSTSAVVNIASGVLYRTAPLAGSATPIAFIAKPYYALEESQSSLLVGLSGGSATMFPSVLFLAGLSGTFATSGNFFAIGRWF